MSLDIKAMISKKSNDKLLGKHMVLRDVNRDLIMALLAIPIYGKEARDEEILSVIINSGTTDSITGLDRVKAIHEKRVANKEIKKEKGGVYRNKSGFLVLVPRV